MPLRHHNQSRRRSWVLPQHTPRDIRTKLFANHRMAFHACFPLKERAVLRRNASAQPALDGLMPVALDAQPPRRL